MTEYLPFIVPIVTALVAFFGGIYAANRKSDTEDFAAIIEANRQLREDMAKDRKTFKDELDAARAEIKSLRIELAETRQQLAEAHRTIAELSGRIR